MSVSKYWEGRFTIYITTIYSELKKLMDAAEVLYMFYDVDKIQSRASNVPSQYPLIKDNWVDIDLESDKIITIYKLRIENIVYEDNGE